MTFISKEIEDAYYASPLPLESTLAQDEKYRATLSRLQTTFFRLYDAISQEQLRLLLDYTAAIAEQHDAEIMFNFQNGYLAATKNNTGTGQN